MNDPNKIAEVISMLTNAQRGIDALIWFSRSGRKLTGPEPLGDMREDAIRVTAETRYGSVTQGSKEANHYLMVAAKEHEKAIFQLAERLAKEDEKAGFALLRETEK